MTRRFWLPCFLIIHVALISSSELRELIANWSSTCKNNHCPAKGDGSDYLTNVVSWTLYSETIRQFDSGNGSPICRTVGELVETITHHVSNYTCQIQWMPNEEICTTLAQYSMITWAGDSLMRHMTQALYILLKQDLQHGGFPRRLDNADIPYKFCSCDGQFSESAICRNYKQEFSFTDVTAQLGVCNYAPIRHLKSEFIADIQSYRHTLPEHNIFIRSPSEECINDTRPMFFLLEGEGKL